MAYDHRDWISLAALGLLASILLLSDLGDPYLWQDEAQTAVIAQTVLAEGLPYGTDGRNYFSQEWGVEYADDYLWRWHTWLSFYVVAGSFALLGETTAAARLPFALFGLATVLLAWVAGRELWRNRAAALASGGLLALSVPFLILSRQCRWYPMAGFFFLVAVLAYWRLRPGRRREAVLLFVAATALFHTHYLYVATLLASLILHAAWLRRDRLRAVLLVSAATTLAALPWIVWFAGIRYGDAYAGHLASLPLTARIGSHLAADLVRFFLHPVFLAIPIGLLLWRRLRGASGSSFTRVDGHAAALLGLGCAVTIAFLAVLAPGAYFRYLAPVAPLAICLAGGAVGALAAESKLAAVAVVAGWLALSPIRDFVHEITHPFQGPIGGLVRFFEERAQPGDVVAISYGDMPLKFYTGLRVVGGLTGEDLADVEGAEWIVVRRRFPAPDDRGVQERLRTAIVPGDYAVYRLPVPDTPFENREDPRFHRYRSAPSGTPRIVVHGKTDAARARDAQASGRSDGPMTPANAGVAFAGVLERLRDPARAGP